MFIMNLITMSYLISLEYQQCPSTGGGAPTSEWVLTDLADSSQLSTPQRLRAKMEKVIHTLKAISLAPRGGGMEGRNLEADRRVRVAEDRARELAEQVSQYLVRDTKIILNFYLLIFFLSPPFPFFLFLSFSLCHFINAQALSSDIHSPFRFATYLPYATIRFARETTNQICFC